MHVVVPKEPLQRGLAAVSRAASSRASLPIQACILLEAEGGQLRFTAFDGDVGLEATIPAEVKVAGRVALPAKTLADVVARLGAHDVELEAGLAATEATLRSGRAKFTLRGMPAAEFPPIPRPNFEEATKLDAKELAVGIRQAVFAAAKEDKAIISGLRFELGEGKLTLAATDGYRLAMREAEVGGTGSVQTTIPRRAMEELGRQLGSVPEGQSVSMALAGSLAAFDLGDRFMSCRTLEGAYPPFRQILPPHFTVEATLDRAAWLGAVERVRILTSDRDANVVKLSFELGELVLSGGGQELGEASEAVACDLQGEAIALSVNANYLAEALKALEGESVQVGMLDARKPVLLQPLGDARQRCVLMPIIR